MDIWNILNIKPTQNQREIKKAYANQTKKYHPEENPEMFKKLHEAYTLAIKYAKDYNDYTYQDYYLNKDIENENIKDDDNIFEKVIFNEDIKQNENKKDLVDTVVLERAFSDYENQRNNSIEEFFKELENQTRLNDSNCSKQNIIQMFLSDEFTLIKHDYITICNLLDFLKIHDNDMDLEVYVYIYRVYELNKLEIVGDNNVYELLFRILSPKFSKYQRDIFKEKQDRNKRKVKKIILIVVPILLVLAIFSYNKPDMLSFIAVLIFNAFILYLCLR